MEYIRLSTPRWGLREIHADDVSRLIEYLNDPDIYANTLLIPYPYSQADALKFITINRELESNHDLHVNWMITDPEDRVIGGIGLLYEYGITSHKSGFGYWIGEPFRGQGLMSEVVNAFSAMIFQHTPLIRLEAHVFLHNPASARVLVKAGYSKEGLMRQAYYKDGIYLDAWMYARLKRI
ncbi:MAG: GNAT family N-acetyltransferase [Saprospiraceae bacterium]|nr:GNAT family N-acetyltransferase [Saprospiraceae bacterium]